MAPQIRVVVVAGDEHRLDRLGGELAVVDDIDVRGATSVETATTALDEGAIDCVVTADELPDGSWTSLVQAVRSPDTELPVILAPENGSERLASEALNAGVSGYVAAGGETGFERLRDRIHEVVDDTTDASNATRAPKLETFFEQSPDPAFEYIFRDGTPHIVSANEAFESTFGYDADEIEGEPVTSVLVPEDSLQESRALDEHAANGDRIDAELDRETADGQREFLFRNITVEADGGKTAGYAVYTDITDQKERERRLERQNEQLDEFAEIVSHDLRNPMEVIKTRVEVARETGDLSHLSHAVEAVDRMEELLSDLRTLAQQGDSVGETEPVDLDSIVDDAWEHVATGGATLSVTADATVDADPGRLTQLFENLFINSVEHATGESRQSGDAENLDLTVEVGVSEDGFYVGDDGPGIPEEDRERVFEYGFSTADDGTGFGLSIVRRVARAHGWQVTITESDSGGACFEFRGVEFY